MSIFKKKKKYAEGGIVPKPVTGITSAEYNKIHADLHTAYVAACDRQKSCDSKPSGYMKGLKEAIKIVDSIKPHNLVGGL